MMPALVGLLILVVMCVSLIVLAYVVWFRWEQFAQFMIRNNHDDPVFRYLEEGLYRSETGKWLCRILTLGAGLLLYLVFRAAW